MRPTTTASLWDGLLVRLERTRRRVAAKDLAEAIGVSAPEMSMWETGRRPLPREVAQAVADHFGVPLETFRRPSGGAAC